MIYFDTDYLIHFLINQNKEAHRFVTRKIESLIRKGHFYVSPLNLQEIGFVLAKLDIDPFLILEKLREFECHCIKNYTLDHFRRTKELASKIGFQNINDCLHVAIAESYCKELYTFNKNDFEKIRPLTTLCIRIF